MVISTSELVAVAPGVMVTTGAFAGMLAPGNRCPIHVLNSVYGIPASPESKLATSVF